MIANSQAAGPAPAGPASLMVCFPRARDWSAAVGERRFQPWGAQSTGESRLCANLITAGGAWLLADRGALCKENFGRVRTGLANPRPLPTVRPPACPKRQRACAGGQEKARPALVGLSRAEERGKLPACCPRSPAAGPQQRQASRRTRNRADEARRGTTRAPANQRHLQPVGLSPEGAPGVELSSRRHDISCGRGQWGGGGRATPSPSPVVAVEAVEAGERVAVAAGAAGRVTRRRTASWGERQPSDTRRAGHARSSAAAEREHGVRVRGSSNRSRTVVTDGTSRAGEESAVGAGLLGRASCARSRAGLAEECWPVLLLREARSELPHGRQEGLSRRRQN